MPEKKSFVLYNDYWDVFEVLSEAELGKLFGAIYKYVLYKEEPEDLPDKALVAFKMVRKDLVRDLAKYEKICGKRSEAARKAAEAQRQRISDNNKKKFLYTDDSNCIQMVANGNNCMQMPANATDNDNDNDNVNVNVNDNVNEYI